MPYHIRVLGGPLLVDGEPASVHVDHAAHEIIVQHRIQADAIRAERLTHTRLVRHGRDPWIHDQLPKRTE